MKVLWFTNTPSCYNEGDAESPNGYNGGGWISSAEREMSLNTDIELAVSFIKDNQPFKVVQNGVIYYPINSNPNKIFCRKLRRFFFSFISAKLEETERAEWGYYISQMQKVVEDYNPDIIHVWGSEGYFGLICLYVNIPIVLHIQGILNPYHNACLPPGVSWLSYGTYSGTPYTSLRRYMEKNEWKMNCFRERTILQNIHYYMGRTEWDKRCTHVFNKESKYYICNEILRDSFYRKSERNIPRKLTIISTISIPLYKGYDLILKTADILKNVMGLDFEWICFGNISPNIIEKHCRIKHLDVNVKLAGVVDELTLYDTMTKATLYFHPSYIDNSPNSICEAQMLGLPVIATNVGGVSSLIQDGQDGFLVPANDPYQSAYLIDLIGKDIEQNVKLGYTAQASAFKRHSKEKIKEEIVSAYNTILQTK